MRHPLEMWGNTETIIKAESHKQIRRVSLLETFILGLQKMFLTFHDEYIVRWIEKQGWRRTRGDWTPCLLNAMEEYFSLVRIPLTSGIFQNCKAIVKRERERRMMVKEVRLVSEAASPIRGPVSRLLGFCRTISDWLINHLGTTVLSA